MLSSSARCAMALHRITVPLNGLVAHGHLLEADFEAERQGYTDYWDGITELPLMFADEPWLMERWRFGFQHAAELAEMQSCSGCQNRAHDWNGVCPAHG